MRFTLLLTSMENEGLTPSRKYVLDRIQSADSDAQSLYTSQVVKEDIPQPPDAVARRSLSRVVLGPVCSYHSSG